MTLTHSIHIDAPADVVWRVTEAVENWPQWTPTMTSVAVVSDGPFGDGSVVRIKQPGQLAADWMITHFARGRGFTWTTARRGLRMAATHTIVADGGGTRNDLRIDVDGLLAVMLWPLLRIAVRHALAAENEGLKTQCEEIARGVTKTA